MQAHVLGVKSAAARAVARLELEKGSSVQTGDNVNAAHEAALTSCRVRMRPC